MKKRRFSVEQIVGVLKQAELRSLHCKDVLVVGALVHILERFPSADIVDQEGREVGPLRLDVFHELVEALPASDVQATSPMVRVNPNDIYGVVRGVLANDVCLVPGRVLLGVQPFAVHGLLGTIFGEVSWSSSSRRRPSLEARFWSF